MKPGNRQASGPVQEPRARGCNQPRVVPLHLLHRVHPGDPSAWTVSAEQASPAPLTLRTGVRYSATSRAFPFTVLITFCILGLEGRWGREGHFAIRTGESETAPDVADWHRAPQAAPAGPRGRGGGTRRPGPAVTWPRRHGPRRRSERRLRAQSPGLPPEAVFRPLAPLAPLPASPSSSHSLPTAPPPPGPHVTRIFP